MPSRPTPRESIALQKGYHSPQLDVEIRLNTNESPVPPPDEFREALAKATAQVTWNRYPDRKAGELRSRIAAFHGVKLDQIFVANGSNEVLQTLLLTYGGKGRCAAVFEPTYALHSHLTKISGTRLAIGTRTNSLQLDLSEIERLVAKEQPDVTFLCSPNNPTGIVDPLVDIEAVLAMVTKQGSLLCVDEAYGEFCEQSVQSLLVDDVPLVVLRTFSKIWALAAARLGYLIGPSWLIEQLWKVVLPYHLNSVSQIAGCIAFDYVDAMQERVSQLVEQRERLITEMGELGLEVWPSGANFVLFRAKHVAGEALWSSLLEKSVLVRNCATWPRLEGCLRVTIGTPDENDRFLEALSEALK